MLVREVLVWACSLRSESHKNLSLGMTVATIAKYTAENKQVRQIHYQPEYATTDLQKPMHMCYTRHRKVVAELVIPYELTIIYHGFAVFASSKRTLKKECFSQMGGKNSYQKRFWGRMTEHNHLQRGLFFSAQEEIGV